MERLKMITKMITKMKKRTKMRTKMKIRTQMITKTLLSLSSTSLPSPSSSPFSLSPFPSLNSVKRELITTEQVHAFAGQVCCMLDGEFKRSRTGLFEREGEGAKKEKEKEEKEKGYTFITILVLICWYWFSCCTLLYVVAVR